MQFTKKAFINCPFDNDYFPLLKSLLFTLVYLQIEPLIAETSDSGEVRLRKIIGLIKKSDISIHDLSRMEPLANGKLPRFNMPFECGIDFGVKLSNPRQKKKPILILEKERFRYQRVISDISGNDIMAHQNQANLLVKSVRDWVRVGDQEDVPNHTKIWFAYNEFLVDFVEIYTKEKINVHDIYSLTFSDIIMNMKTWLNASRLKPKTFSLSGIGVSS